MRWFRWFIGALAGGDGSARDATNQEPRAAREVAQRVAALSYATRLTLGQQRARLTTFGPYIWIDRDSDQNQDYISTRCYPDYGFFKIFDAVDGRFHLTIELVTDRQIVEAELEKLLLQAHEHVLSVIDATDVETAEPYD
jgi:hypothetical protein